MISKYEDCLPLHQFAKDKSPSKYIKSYTLQTTNPKLPSAMIAEGGFFIGYLLLRPASLALLASISIRFLSHSLKILSASSLVNKILA